MSLQSVQRAYRLSTGREQSGPSVPVRRRHRSSRGHTYRDSLCYCRKPRPLETRNAREVSKWHRRAHPSHAVRAGWQFSASRPPSPETAVFRTLFSAGLTMNHRSPFANRSIPMVMATLEKLTRLPGCLRRATADLHRSVVWVHHPYGYRQPGSIAWKCTSLWMLTQFAVEERRASN